MSDDSFYVGYLEAAPAPLARFLKPRILALVLAAAGVAAALTIAQNPFSAAAFEFGTTRSFEGIYRRQPAPTLVLEHPAGGGSSRYLLSAFGKMGAGPQLEGLEGRRVRLQGTLVYRDDQTMIELVSGSVEALDSAASASLQETWSEDLGERTLRGEIVDSKCFLGVMKPGRAKPHRACATRCISGGVPPVLLVRDPEGQATYFLLTDEAGAEVGSRILDRVAEPLEIRGRVLRYDNLWVLRADPATYLRLED